MRVVVFGASGIQGRHQVHHLARTGHTVVAISRTSKALPPDIPSISVEQISLDFTSASSSELEQVLHGADRLFLNLPSTSFNPSAPLLAAVQRISTASENAGIPLILFNTSMPVPLEKQDIKAQDDRREMRAILRASSLPVISIQPVVYLDNLLEGWALPPLRDEKRLVYCHDPDLRVSWICHHDVAQIMVAAMQRPRLAGMDIPVGGRETVVLSELGDELSRAWGTQLEVENQTVADFCDKISRTMRGRGLDSEKVVSQMLKAYTYYNEAADEPFRVDMGDLAEELGVKLTGIEEWAARRSPWNDKGYF